MIIPDLLFSVNETNCGCNRLLYEVSPGGSGEISSPQYPKEYCHKLRCYYVIRSTSAKHGVELTFDKVDTENAKDFVYIYDIIDVYQLTEVRKRHKEMFLAR